ncbi:tetratricopeptide repeat protein [Pedosphaera parvula]|nr:tetratricopeptide repeat protein [Pedosphaera parvula]
MAGKEKIQSESATILPWIFVALTAITLLLYMPSLKGDFVNYDDPDYVTANVEVQKGLTGESIRWAFTTGHASNWHPLTWLSHMVDYQLYELKPAGHHATNLILHTANVLLLFWVLWRSTKNVWPSAVVAALFAWHPLHVESVAWISERKDVLSAFFWLLTMWAYAEHVRGLKESGKKTMLFYGLSLMTFALGLLSKPMLVTLPFVLLLLDYWPLNRLSLESKSAWPRLMVEKVPFFLLAFADSVTTFLVQKKGGAVSSLESIALGERIANAFVSYLRYVGKMVWPENLSILYPHPHPAKWPILLVIASVVFVLGMSAAAVVWGRKQRYLFVGWFWFLGTMVPVIGLVQVGIQAMADRYSYIPHIGLFIVLAWGVPEMLASWKQRMEVLVLTTTMALIACLALTLNQEKYWCDSVTLFTHATRVTKNNYLAYNNLGHWLDNQGKPDEALANYQKSIEINPNYDEAQNNIGYVLAKKGKPEEAIPYYFSSLRLNPNRAEVHNNLGNAYADLGKLDEAIREYQAALKINTNYAEAYNGIGISLAKKGDLAGATRWLSDAIRLNPKNVSSHSNLGNVYAMQGKFDLAAIEYKLVLKQNPDDALTHNNLANLLSEQGKLDEAIGEYRSALKLKADNPEANYNLGLALLRQNKRDEARQHFNEALRLRPNYPEAQRQLGGL